MPAPAPIRRGAALLVVLAAVALVGSLLAVAGARRYTLLAGQKRDDVRARLRVAAWDAVWSDLRLAAAQPKSLPGGGPDEAPDGVQTVVEARPAAGGKESGRFEVSVTASLGRARHEGWALVQRTGEGFRILTWVER
jgi:hypothetical protein